MKFAEELPAQCPPGDAADVAHKVIYRLIPTHPPTKDHFKSHAELGIAGGEHDPCGRRSCSLLVDPLKWVRGLPRMLTRYRYAVQMSIPTGSGMSKSNKNSTHVHFWPYATFDPLAAVVDVIELPEAPSNG